MDPRGVILDWSARAEAAFGWSRDEVLGRGLIEVLAPLRHQTAYRQILARRLASPEPPAARQKSQLMAVAQGRGRGPDRGVAGRVRERNACSSVSSATSPTASRSTSAGRQRGAVPGRHRRGGRHPVDQRRLGPDGRRPARLVRLTGQTPDQYQGFGWVDAVHPDDAEPTIQAWRTAVAQGGPYTFEHRVRRHDGVWRDFVRAVAALEADGSIREWIGVHTDITERKRAEERLREGEARFRAMADSAPAPVWMTSAEGGITFANEAFAEFAGVDARALLGDAWIRMIHPDDIAGVGAKRAAARGAPRGPAPTASRPGSCAATAPIAGWWPTPGRRSTTGVSSRAISAWPWT
jgi:PAS domain S-box-containing protein